MGFRLGWNINLQSLSCHVATGQCIQAVWVLLWARPGRGLSAVHAVREDLCAGLACLDFATLCTQSSPSTPERIIGSIRHHRSCRSAEFATHHSAWAQVPHLLLAQSKALFPRWSRCQNRSFSKMTLGEAYIKDILRPPPTGSVPANVAHPFQTSFYTYLTKKFIPRHWYLAAGFTFTLTLYGTLDGLREAGKKKAYDAAVMEGRQPCKFARTGVPMGTGRCLPGAWASMNNNPTRVSINHFASSFFFV